MLENQLSRYGALSRIISDLAPSAKVFLVGDSDDTTYGIENLAAEYPVDKDGIVRVYNTIQSAVNACRVNCGDVILVAPNYNQSLISADSWNVAGVRIVGMGQGEQRAKLTFDIAGATVNLGANAVCVSNIMFKASVSGITRALDLDTGFSGQKVDNCVFTYDTNGDDFITSIRIGSKNAIVEKNGIIMEDTAGPRQGIALLGGEAQEVIIRDNVIIGQFDTVADASGQSFGAISQDTSDISNTNLRGVLIENNKIINYDTAGAIHIRFSAGYTNRGLITGNRVASYDTSSIVSGQVARTGLRMTNNIGNSDSAEAVLLG